MENDDLTPLYIPPSFKAPIVIFNNAIPFKFFIEGIIFALIPVPFFIYIAPNFGFDFRNMNSIVTMVLSCGVFGLLGITGINNATIPELLYMILKYQKRKRVCYYNDRVKTQDEFAISLSDLTSDDSKFSEEMLKHLATKITTTSQENRIETAEQRLGNIARPDNLFFEDDIGKVEKPWEYMTKAERKEFLKAEQKQRSKKQVKKKRRVKHVKKKKAK